MHFRATLKTEDSLWIPEVNIIMPLEVFLAFQRQDLPVEGFQ
jgi:hypothetical protein